MVGYFRSLRRKRVIRLEEDLDFGIHKIMRERWDFLTLIEFYQNLEELESLIQKNKIVEEPSVAEFVQAFEKIKKNYPFEKHAVFPSWDFNHFLAEVLYLAGNLKKAMLLPAESESPLPSYNPTERAWRILDGFFAAAQKRRDNIEEEEKRITTFILIATKKHVYYMQLLLSVLSIVIGLVIGWIFSR